MIIINKYYIFQFKRSAIVYHGNYYLQVDLDLGLLLSYSKLWTFYKILYRVFGIFFFFI